MKADFSGRFQLRIMLYTLISFAAGVIAFAVTIAGAVEFGILVMKQDGRLPDSAIRPIAGQNDFFYRMLGIRLDPVLPGIAVIIGVLVFLLVFWLLTNRMSRKVRKMAEDVADMAMGNLDIRLSTDQKDEFGRIAFSINQLAETINTSRERAEEAEKMKNTLITSVAHDLRTPLTSVIGYLDLVRSDPDMAPEQRSKCLSIAGNKAGQLKNMIDDLFSFSTSAYTETPLDLKKVNVITFLGQVLDEMYPVFEENDLKVTFEKDAAVYEIMADSGQLVRVFENLLGNAVRYGKNGKRIRVFTRSAPDQIQLHIINFGVIISAEDLPYIFDKFYKADRSRSSGQGAGLGLAIAKSITLRHGGSITASSSFEGTDFCVTLPAAPAGGQEEDRS